MCIRDRSRSASLAVRSLLERASADMSPAFQGMLQGASADDLVLRDTARAARDALRDPAVGRALADFSSPAVRAALRSAPPPGRNRRPAKASDQREASGPAAARSETAKPSAEEPDTN